MNQTALYTLIGNLVNDPNHDRYTTPQIDQQLDNIQTRWNVEAGILRQTDATITLVAGQRQYPLSLITKTILDVRRATFLGKALSKRSKGYIDLYTGYDWTQDNGTPSLYFIELDTSLGGGGSITLYPTPQSADVANANGFVIEYIYAHTPLASPTDIPFNALTLMIPYHYGLAYESSANLLAQDPDPANQIKMDRYQRIANNVLAEVTQTYKSLEKEEPMRMTGGRFWSTV